MARLRLKRYSELDITRELAEQGIVNARTGRPYSAATVHNDLAALEREWREAAAQDYATHKGNMLASLQEAERCAWKGRWGKPELSLVLKALEQQARVLGLIPTDSSTARSREREEFVHRATEDFRLGAEAAREVYRRMQAEKERQGEPPHE